MTWTPPGWLLEIAAGDHGMIAELIGIFQEATETSLTGIRAALAAGDSTELRSEAHRAKGGARQIGADEVAMAFEALELAPELTPVLRLGEQVSRCQQLFQETCGAMGGYSGGAQPADFVAPLLRGVKR